MTIKTVLNIIYVIIVLLGYVDIIPDKHDKNLLLISHAECPSLS